MDSNNSSLSPINHIAADIRAAQQGFSLFEVLIAALIMSIALAGIMRLHTRNLQQTASNAQLQQAYWWLSNAQQRYWAHQSLSAVDIQDLTRQARQFGLMDAKIQVHGASLHAQWRTDVPEDVVMRGACQVPLGFSCMQVPLVYVNSAQSTP